MEQPALASELGVFSRIIRTDRGPMSVKLARYILSLGFDAQDQARMEELSTRNQQGALSAQEQAELMSFVKASHLLALLHSKARQTLKKKKVS